MGQLEKLGARQERTHSPAAMFSFYCAAAIKRGMVAPEEGLQLMEKSVAALSLALKTGWNPASHAGDIRATRKWLAKLQVEDSADGARVHRLIRQLRECQAEYFPGKGAKAVWDPKRPEQLRKLSSDRGNWSAFHCCASAFAGSRQDGLPRDRIDMLRQANMSLHEGFEIGMDGFKALIALMQQSLQDLNQGYFSCDEESFEQARGQFHWLQDLVNRLDPRMREHGQVSSRPARQFNAM